MRLWVTSPRRRHRHRRRGAGRRRPILQALALAAVVTFAAAWLWPGEEGRRGAQRQAWLSSLGPVTDTGGAQVGDPVARLAPGSRIALATPRVVHAAAFGVAAGVDDPPAIELRAAAIPSPGPSTPSASPAAATVAPSTPPPAATSPRSSLLALIAPRDRTRHRAALEPGAGPRVAALAPPIPVPAERSRPPATLPDLPEPVPEGLLPDGPGRLPAWLQHAALPPAAPERPAVAIVIDDLGMNPRGTAEIARLPAPLTLAFLPYARALEEQARLVREAGHEVMVHVPMEPIGSEYPGPNALLTSLPAEEILRRLRWGLDRVEGHVGVNNHMGSRFTAEAAGLGPVMAELRRRGLLFLDSRTSAVSIAAREAGRHGVPNATRSVFLDNVLEAGAIRAQLDEVERVARQSGAAIAIGHPHRVTVEVLTGWLAGLERRGFQLVPVSTLVARNACRDGLSVAACTALAEGRRDGPRLADRAAPEPGPE